jgi:tRNA (guanosine-2'-O-)-methyltransferase
VPTKERVERVNRVLSSRQPDLRVVLENIAITHNASAVVRTCDAAGVLNVDIISTVQEPLLVNKAISTRAEKWVQLRHYSSAAECLSRLKEKGLKIAVTHLGEDSMLYTELDYTQPLALVFGNESEGISKEAMEMADFKIKIPMVGMVKSLNLSVSVGIILYEAFKQRRESGFFDKRRLPPKDFEKLYNEWLKIEENDVPPENL